MERDRLVTNVCLYRLLRLVHWQARGRQPVGSAVGWVAYPLGVRLEATAPGCPARGCGRPRCEPGAVHVPGWSLSGAWLERGSAPAAFLDRSSQSIACCCLPHSSTCQAALQAVESRRLRWSSPWPARSRAMTRHGRPAAWEGVPNSPLLAREALES